MEIIEQPQNVEPPRIFLTDYDKTLLTDELIKMDDKLAEILHILDTDQEEFPELFQYANDITKPEGE
jgi:hypothetical protein